MAQLRNLREGGGYAMEECRCLVDVDQQATDLPQQVDGALLMELMEDLPPSGVPVDDGGDVDRLSNVIRSLEAEIIIDDGEAAGAMVVDDELATGVVVRRPSDNGGRLLEDMLSDLDEYEGGSSFPYWPDDDDVPFEVDGSCTYMDGCEGSSIAVHESTVDRHQYYYAAESSAAELEVYIPLWEW